eukprot:comp23529_c0_seq2/m.39575 comp23529_c0_seq2/g.39575  ORF comp23529_c0_seq2/g.39575 comp23529_c0_seq2/m.39575 type:complete len:693 (-) comp23529_c0_seq2:599-2677(-)
MSGFYGQQHYGVTEPISQAGPTETDLILSEKLEQTLKDMDIFESEEEAMTRQEVLGKLNVMVKDWVREVAKLKNVPESMLDQVTGCIHTFGSYRLGVHGKGADIDTLCLAPKHVDREHFFDILYNKLAAREEVTQITAIKEAFVPVIKMEFSGISIDLIMAKLNLASVDESVDLLNPSILKEVEEVSVRSINGCRVTDQILKLVPNPHTFRTALRCIKQWAQRRGIYPNAMGFLGGIGWAMLVARTCQLYPNAAASTLVSRFFRVFHQWQWPTPVLLKHIEDANLGMKVWNPKLYPKDGKDLMPIITPAYPSMNASHNVMMSTLRMMKEEFERGVEMTLKIENGHATWKDLFAKTDFFHRFKNFIQVDSITYTEEDHLHMEHLLEVRLKVLVSNLERTANVAAAYPYTKGFTAKLSREEYEKRANKPMLEVKEDKADTKSDTVWVASFFIGLIFPSKEEIGGPVHVDLTPAVADFLSRIKERHEKKDTLELEVHHVKRADLPDFVWGDGEKPAPKKRSKKTQQGASGKRRRVSTDQTAKSPGADIKGEVRQSSEAQQSLVASAPHTTHESHELEMPMPTTPLPGASPGGAQAHGEGGVENGVGVDSIDATDDLDAALEAMKREVMMNEADVLDSDLPADLEATAELDGAVDSFPGLDGEEGVDELSYDPTKALAQPPTQMQKSNIKLVLSKK